MKQTNNAIKFLLAQYRAIFQHAYLKGIVSAAVLTAGLTAGAANAVPTNILDEATWKAAFDGNSTVVIGGDDYVMSAISSSGSYELKDNQTLKFTGNSSSDGSTIDAVISNGADQAITIGGSGKGNIIVDLKSNSQPDSPIAIYNNGTASNANVTVDVDKIDIRNGSLSFTNLGAASTSTLKANTINVDGNNKYDAYLTVGGSKDGNGSGSFIVGKVGNASNVTSINVFGDNANFDIHGSSDSSGSVEVEIVSDKLNINSGTFKLWDKAQATIKSKEVNIENTTWFTIKSDAQLTLDLGAAAGVNGGTFTTTNVEHGIDGALTIQNGDMTVKDAIEFAMNSGSTLEVKNGSTFTMLNSEFTVAERNGAASKILVSGTGSVIDLSQSPIVLKDTDEDNHYSGATFTATDGGTLKLDADNVQDIIDQAVEDGSKSINFVASGSNGNTGVIDINGDIELNYTAANAAALNNIIYVDDGGLVRADSLTVKATDSDDNNDLAFKLAGGALELGKLSLSAYNSKNAIYEEVTLGSGTYTVLSDLSSYNKTINLDKATVNLGKIDNKTPENSIGGGSISSDLTLTNSSLNVDFGTWSGKNLTIKDAASSLNIGTQGSLSLTELNTGSATNNQVNIDGSLSLAGFTNTKDIQKSGITLSKDSVNLTGTLTFGSGIAEDITVKTADGSSTVTANGITAEAINMNGGTLVISFSGGEFSSDELKAMKKYLFGTDSIDGTLNIGDAKIGSLNLTEEQKDENGRYDFDLVTGVSDVTTGGVTNNELTNNSFTTSTGSNVAGTVGSIHVEDSSTARIDKSASFVNSATNNGLFVSTYDSSAKKDVAADINFTGATLKLENGGTAGDVILGDSELVVRSSADAKTVLGDVKGSTATFTVQGPVSAQAVNVQSLDVAEGMSLQAKTLDVVDDVELEGTLAVSGDATFKNAATFNDVTSIGEDLTVKGDLDVAGNTTVKGVASLGADVLVADNASLVADSIKMTTANSILSVGLDAQGETAGSTGYLRTEFLDLNGGTLIVDPSYGQAASIAIIGKTTDDVDFDAGSLKGNIVAAQNGIAVIGFDNATEATAIDQVKEVFSSLLDEKGSLSKDNIGSIVYVGKNLEVQSGHHLIADSTTTGTAVKTQLENPSSAYNTYDAYIGKNSAIAIDENALNAIYGAIHFDRKDATIYNNGGKVLLVGDNFNTRDDIVLFTDNGNTADSNSTGVKIVGKDLRAETLNGLFYIDYVQGKETTKQSLQLNTDNIDAVFNDASYPVKDTLIAYAARDNNWEQEGKDGYEEDKLHGELVTNITTTDGTTFVKKGTTETVDAKKYVAIKGENNQFVVYEAAYNDFLDAVVRESYSGKPAEQAARMSIFGGTAQAALTAGATTYDAISGRFGVGAQYGSITFADNGQGAGLWVTPVYKNHDSDGFGSQGLTYGADLDMYGVALGGDFTMANGLRVGAAFNVGSGDADGNGAAAGVSNDFDYYGFAVYGGFSMDNLSVVADVSYTVVDNDVEANNNIDKLTASMDSSNLSVGVTGQYAMNYGGMSITPHAGLRYTYIDMDDYNIKGVDSGDVAHFAGDSFSVFSIPVGITFAKEIVSGDWTVKPAFDLTLTANMGDDSAEGTVNWAGIDNLQTRVESEVIDSFTYGATLGITAKSGNLSLGFGVNYTGASNADEYGVGANARFVF